MSPELGRRIAFTLGALLVYRLGSYIPLPGIDFEVWSRIFSAGSGGILGLYNSLSGGSISRLAIFALGILPYVTAAFLFQLVMIGFLRVRALSDQGYRGRQKIVAWTRVLTVLLTAFQSYGIAVALERIPGVVANPGMLFKFSTILTLSAGTMFLVWLCDQITLRGIGNGIAVVLVAGIAVELPFGIVSALEEVRRGTISPDRMAIAAILVVAVTALIAFVEGSRRRIIVDYPKREIDGRVFEAASSPISLKFNNAGIFPATLASWFIGLALLVAAFIFGPTGGIVELLGPGSLVNMVLYAVLILGFTLFYTSFLIGPDGVSETLKANGAAIRGVASGEATAEYVDDAVSRMTLVAMVYLVAVVIGPELLRDYFHVPFYLGGQTLLVLVCATLDLKTQVEQQMQLQPGGYSR